MATVFWDSEEIVLNDYLGRGITIRGTYYTDLIGKCQVALALKEKRQGKLHHCLLFHLFTHYYNHGLPSEMPVSNCFVTYLIHQTCC